MPGTKDRIDFYRTHFGRSVDELARVEEIMSLARQNLTFPEFELRIIAPSGCNDLDKLGSLGAGTGIRIYGEDGGELRYELDLPSRTYIRKAADSMDETRFYLTDNVALECLHYARDRKHPARNWAKTVAALYAKKGILREFISMLTSELCEVVVL